MTDPGAEASREAIAAERLRSIRFVGLFRFVGISIAGALNLLLPLVVPAMQAYQSDLRRYAAYWLIATAVFWATRRSSRLCDKRSGGCERRARSSLLRRAFRHASSVVAALAALAPRLVCLARHDYSDRLLGRGARSA